MYLETVSRPCARALATNSTDSSFASKIPTTTAPINDGVLDLTLHGNLVPKFAKLWFIGLGADNDAFSVRVLGWQKIKTGASGINIWWPSIICELAVIVSAAVGVSGSPVLATERFADTITIVTQGKNIDADSGGAASRGNIEITSPASDMIAHAVVPLKGFERIEFTFDQTTNTPTMNVLYSFL